MNEIDISTGDEFAIIGRLALAGILGAVIGLERELRGYPAGIRTLALVTLGSALFTEGSQLFPGGADRMAAQIVTGIGFLGAGVIFREGYTVRGITTAATIWSAAGVGVAIGLELYFVAVFGTLFIFALLEARPVTRRVERIVAGQRRNLRDSLNDLMEGAEDENDEKPSDRRDEDD